MSLRRKLTILFLGVALIPVIFVSALTFHNYQTYIEADKLHDLRIVASYKADKIETYFKDLKLYFELNQVADVIKKNLPILTRHSNEPESFEFMSAKHLIDEVYRRLPSSLGIVDVMLTNPSGRIVYCSNPEHLLKEFLKPLPDEQQKAFREGRDKVYFSDIFFDKIESDRPFFLIAGPAYDFGGNFIGVIAAEVDMVPIYAIIQDVTGLGTTGETLIGKKVGNEIVFLNPLRFDPHAALTKRIVVGNKWGRGIQDAAQGKTGAGQFLDYRGKPVMGAWRYLPLLNWGVVAKLDTQEAFVEITNLKNLISVILAIIFVLGAIMSFSIAQSISGPINKLSKGAEIIGSGNLDCKVSTDLKDEIGQLSRAFDKMTAEQKRAQERLRSASQYARSLIEASLDPLVTISADGKITDVNVATIKATGKARDELVGTDFSSYFTEPGKAQEGYRQAFAKGFVTDYPLTIRHKDGKLTDVLYNASVYNDARGNALGVFAAARDVTLLKQAEAELKRHRDSLEELVKERTAALRENEDRLTHALNAGEFGTWGLDIITGKAWRSLRHDQIFGYENLLPEWTYSMFLEHVLNEDRKQVHEKFDQALSKAGEWNIECRIKRADGAIRWIWAQGKPKLTEKGSVAMFTGLIQDITDRKNAEEALLTAHAQLEQKVAMRTSQLLLVNEELNREIEERRKIEMQIRARNALLKFAATKITKKEYLDVVVKLVRGWSRCQYAGVRLLDDNGFISFESHTGYPPEFLETEGRVSIQSDKCVCTRVSCKEIGSAEEKMMTKQGSFYCTNTETFLAGLSNIQKTKLRGACMAFGFKSLVVMPIYDKDKIIGALHIADKKEGLPTLERMEFIETLGPRIGEDVVKFTLAERMQQSSALLEKVFSSTSFCFVLLDKNFNFIRVNEAYARASGHPNDFFSGKNHFDIYPHQETKDIFKKVVETGVPYTVFSKPFSFTDGSDSGISYWDWNLQPVKDENGGTRELVFTLVDVTKRKAAEEELIRAQNELQNTRRLSDIGTLAATVAHELRNPLAAIQVATYNVRRKAANPDIERNLGHIEKKVQESNQIINNLLYYSRIRSPHFEKVRIVPILNECIRAMRKRFQKSITLNNTATLKQISIFADPLQIKEVFNNILVNSCEAVELKEGKIDVLVDRAQNEKIDITICDNGVGISPEFLEKIFEPFFSTKSKGTGLGLSVCRQIVELHHGTIKIESSMNQGTKVIVSLPVSVGKGY